MLFQFATSSLSIYHCDYLAHRRRRRRRRCRADEIAAVLPEDSSQLRTREAAVELQPFEDVKTQSLSVARERE